MDDLPAPPAGKADMAPQTDIPDKLVFRMGEVSRLMGVEAYVLRYWEMEFKGLSPKKSSTGQRMFRRRDVELLLQIKHLLYERKFTIEGARQWLAEHPGRERVNDMVNNSTIVAQTELFPLQNPLPEIRREVAEILKLMKL
jgi:DNA-binding transcriptional MerR regulator